MNILLERLLKNKGADKIIVDCITDSLCPSDFGLEQVVHCEGGCTNCWNVALGIKPRKTAKQMLAECKEKKFDFNSTNYYVFIESGKNVRVGCHHGDMLIGLKYISWEDADYIVRECKENN